MITDPVRVGRGMRPGSARAQPRSDGSGVAWRGRAGAKLGFTLAEATIALVILGMAAAGVLLPFSSGAAVQAEGLRVTLAAKLANDLLERIIATPTSQIVPMWDGRIEVQGQVKDAGDVVFTDPMYANFSRQAVCVDVRVPQESEDLPSNFIRVSIHVGYQGREIATLSRLISK